MDAFHHIVTSEQELRDMLGIPAERSVLKERPALDAHFRAFIAHSPFLLMATAGADGTGAVAIRAPWAAILLAVADATACAAARA